KNTGVIHESGVTEDIESPPRLSGNGVAGSTVPKHRSPDNVLDQSLGLERLLPEHLGRLAVHQLVAVTMAGHFMASVMNFPHQGWITFGNPTQYKKCRARVLLSEEVQ